jgi:hypothetical protein
MKNLAIALGFIGTAAIAAAIVTGLSTEGAHVAVRLLPRNATIAAVSCEILGICVRMS